MDTSAARGPKGGAALFSCSKGQIARESKELKHGVFFYHFIQALTDPKRANERGEVTWSRVQEWVTEQVDDYVREKVGGGARQEPHEVKDIAGRSPLLVTLKSAGGSGGGTDDEKAEAFEWKGEKRTRKVLTLDLGGKKLKFVRIKAGKFEMGLPDTDKDAENREKPQHAVTLTKDDYLGEHAVTVEQFAAFVKATGHETTTEKAKDESTWRKPRYEQKGKGHQVVYVSHDDAVAFCVGHEAGKADGAVADGGAMGIRLPGRDDDEVLHGRRTVEPRRIRERVRQGSRLQVQGRVRVHVEGGHVQAEPVRSIRVGGVASRAPASGHVEVGLRVVLILDRVALCYAASSSKRASTADAGNSTETNNAWGYR